MPRTAHRTSGVLLISQSYGDGEPWPIQRPAANPRPLRGPPCLDRMGQEVLLD